MQNNKIHKLYEKIEMLESKKIAYLEVNNNASARRIEKQIEIEIQVSEYNKIKQELSIYKEVINNYPSLKLEIKKKFLEQI